MNFAKRIPFMLFELVILCHTGSIFVAYLFHLWENAEMFPSTKPCPEMTVAVVACGNRFNESLTMIKSAVILATWPLKIIVFADDDLMPKFETELDEWQKMTNDSFTFDVLPIAFPEALDADLWRGLFKPCASQRLFIPDLLPDVDSVLYVDTDVVFLAPPEEAWRRFHFMNASQMAALSPEHETGGWYKEYLRHPFYGQHGVNSGVMLMNLTRMRSFNWTDHVVRIHRQYRFVLLFGDQDIINILFSSHPDKLYVFPCRFNYRSDHCTSECASADNGGVVALHGNRGSFHGTDNPPFRTIYTSVKEHRLGRDTYGTLYDTMRLRLANTSDSSCGKMADIYTRAMEPYIMRNYLVH